MMGVFDNIGQTVGQTVGQAVDKGIGAVSGAASNALIEHAPFLQGFVRLCNDGWLQGWHERNGGNLTYRMTDEDIKLVRAGLNETPEPWIDLGFSTPSLAGSFFLVTGSGSYMRNIATAPAENIGIVELDQTGRAYRLVWGLKSGIKPTSELPSHIMNHAVRMEATDGACRVLYHAHPSSVIAMTCIEPLDARTFSRALWKAMTECVLVFPEGVGVVPWMVPGGIEIGKATSEQMKKFGAVVWAQHGLFASGETFDSTFGLMHTIEKAAGIYCKARTMNGGSNDFLNTISDAGLMQISDEFNLKINKEFLDL